MDQTSEQVEETINDYVDQEAHTDDSLQDSSKGKIKKLFRKLEDSFQEKLKNQLSFINNQIKKIEESLDKKYGGMYKVLIHEFLTNQESKIYNIELLSQATRNLLADHIYNTLGANKDSSREDFMKEFNVKFQEEMKTINDQVSAKLKEESKDAKQDAQKEEATA